MIETSTSFTAPANVENIAILFGRNANATGNGHENTLIGNSGINVLFGMNGDDLVIAGIGNDTLHGGAGHDELYGEIGNDTLDGGTGADELAGGTGNDTYTVDNPAGDVVTEAREPGHRHHPEHGSHRTLPLNVENLTLLGAAAVNGAGNTLANIIVGNGANNVLNGLAGVDSLRGGLGNDSYIVDNVSDQVVETAGSGTDRIVSSVTEVLALNVENLTLAGTAAINGSGNTLNNVITGNAANNILAASRVTTSLMAVLVTTSSSAASARTP